MLKVGLGKRPSRPAPSGPSWIKWGLTKDIWLLMEECWKSNPAERPSAQEVIDRLSLSVPAGTDRRPQNNWGDSTFSQLRIAVGDSIQYPSVYDLEAMLWGKIVD